MSEPGTYNLIPCWNCDGKGILTASEKQCDLCDGTQMIQCEHEVLDSQKICKECGADFAGAVHIEEEPDEWEHA